MGGGVGAMYMKQSYFWVKLLCVCLCVDDCVSEGKQQRRKANRNQLMDGGNSEEDLSMSQTCTRFHMFYHVNALCVSACVCLHVCVSVCNLGT